MENPQQIIQQIQNEIMEIEVHLKDKNQNKLQEEIGDLLHAAFSLCIFCQFDADETVENSVIKFARRFKKVQRLAKEQGLENLQGQSFNILMDFWNKAKIAK